MGTHFYSESTSLGDLFCNDQVDEAGLRNQARIFGQDQN